MGHRYNKRSIIYRKSKRRTVSLGGFLDFLVVGAAQGVMGRASQLPFRF